MSKRVHPLFFRKGHASSLNSKFREAASLPTLNFFDRQDNIVFQANGQRGKLSRSVRQSAFLSEVLGELFQRSGYFVESFNFQWSNHKLVVVVTVFHRTSTSAPFKDTDFLNQGKLNVSGSRRNVRRITWTNRALPWRYLSKKDFCFFEDFFRSYLNAHNSRDQVLDAVHVNVGQCSLSDYQETLPYQSLSLALQSIQNQDFFQDTLALLSRAAEKPSADLMGQLLQLELGSLRNQQILLDMVSQGLRSIIRSDRFILKACLIQVKGRINGSDRAKIFQFREGSIPLHTLDAAIDYSFNEVKTRYGILSIKIYLRY